MSLRPLAPCRCGHPGAGCSCYEERAVEAGWRRITTGVAVVDLAVLAPTREAEPVEPSPEVVAEVERNICRKCGAMIRVMVFRGTGRCSGRCQAAES